MRVSRETAVESRNGIAGTASRMFREAASTASAPTRSHIWRTLWSFRNEQRSHR